MAAQLGDTDLFRARWSQATDAHRKRDAESSRFYSVTDGATDRVLQLLPYADNPAAAPVDTALMFQQLHMLQQFIKPETT